MTKTTQKDLRKFYSSLHEESSGITHAQRLLDIRTNIDNCGCGILFKCPNSECTEQGNNYSRIFRQYCGHRICRNPGCIAKRQKTMQRKYDPKLNNFKDPRFITLTLKGYHTLTRTPHQRLNYAWKRLSLLLRKSGLVKRYLKVTELVPHEYVNAEGTYIDVYFWHLHIVYDGFYIPADVLRSSWEHFTGDSKWVNITRVKKNISASAYIRKYLTKLIIDDLEAEEYYKVYKMKLISHYNCQDELETVLELHILIRRSVCPHCGSKLVPAPIDKPPPPKALNTSQIIEWYE